MEKPVNPYKHRSLTWALLEEDWSDLTANEIAEVFGTSRSTIYSCIRRIRVETGYEVQYVRQKKVKSA